MDKEDKMNKSIKESHVLFKANYSGDNDFVNVDSAKKYITSMSDSDKEKYIGNGVGVIIDRYYDPDEEMYNEVAFVSFIREGNEVKFFQQKKKEKNALKLAVDYLYNHKREIPKYIKEYLHLSEEFPNE